MGEPVKISAVIITYNEEKNIERCLRSVEGIADEIVVVDSFSDDGTRALCSQFGAIFITHKFEGYGDQKKWAVLQARHDYILSLDADEALSEKLRNSISSVKNNWDSDGYTFNRLTNYIGKWIRHCGWYPDCKLRLFDRKKGDWTGYNLHEKVMMVPGAKIAHLKGDLLHYSYYSIQQHVAQINRFTDFSSLEAFEKGQRATLPEAIVKSCWKFVRDYIFKLGFLDGYYGYVICRLSAIATFVKYIKIKHLEKIIKHD